MGLGKKFKKIAGGVANAVSNPVSAVTSPFVGALGGSSPIGAIGGLLANPLGGLGGLGFNQLGGIDGILNNPLVASSLAGIVNKPFLGGGGGGDNSGGIFDGLGSLPSPPDFNSVLNDAKTGFLSSNLSLDPSSILSNLTNDIGVARTFRDSTTDSPLLASIKEGIGLDFDQMYDNAELARSGSLEEATNRLAARGGLKSGAAERLEEVGMKNKMLNLQRLGLGEAQELNKANVAELQNKQNLISTLPGIEANKAQLTGNLQESNIRNILQQRGLENEEALKKYKILSDFEASKIMGAAQANTALNTGGLLGSGGMLGTGINLGGLTGGSSGGGFNLGSMFGGIL